MAFTTTSHIAVTAVMAMAVFLAVTILGFVKNGFGFLSVCFGFHLRLLSFAPFWRLIEVISYFVRPVSHSIRLAGNMMAGHAVIKVFAAFAPLVLISTGIGSGGHAALDPRDHRNICPRSAGSLHSGLCFRNFDLRVSARCFASAPLRFEI